MLSIGIAVAVGLLYSFKMFVPAFWVLVCLIVNGSLGVIKATVDPDWYMMQKAEAGVLGKPGDGGLGGLYVVKGIILVAEAALAWHVGSLAGYF